MIKLRADALKYLAREANAGVLLDMLRDRVATSCCGLGRTRPFFTTYVRAVRPGESFGVDYECVRVGEVPVFLSPRAQQALAQEGGDWVIGTQLRLSGRDLALVQGPEVVFGLDEDPAAEPVRPPSDRVAEEVAAAR
ncbi:MAG: hypothetical protein LBR33_01755 [Propionibacteriaceae bacterium]|jgi:hypothetical protein|nr:hypothetical protein [Propionibacteriaceae bacterium]